MIIRSGGAFSTAIAVDDWPTDEAVALVLWSDGRFARVSIDGIPRPEVLELPVVLTGLTTATVGAAGDGSQPLGVEIVRAAVTSDPNWLPVAGGGTEWVKVADQATADAQVPSRYLALAYPVA
jgi:hypothetical protein